MQGGKLAQDKPPQGKVVAGWLFSCKKSSSNPCAARLLWTGQKAQDLKKNHQSSGCIRTGCFLLGTLSDPHPCMFLLILWIDNANLQIHFWNWKGNRAQTLRLPSLLDCQCWFAITGFRFSKNASCLPGSIVVTKQFFRRKSASLSFIRQRVIFYKAKGLNS